MDTVQPVLDDVKTAIEDNKNVVTSSYQAWTAGCQSITQSVLAISQARIDHSLSHWTALSAATSPREAMGISSEHAWKSIQQGLADTARLTNEVLQLNDKVLKPLRTGRAERLENLSFLGG